MIKLSDTNDKLKHQENKFSLQSFTHSLSFGSLPVNLFIKHWPFSSQVIILSQFNWVLVI